MAPEIIDLTVDSPPSIPNNQLSSPPSSSSSLSSLTSVLSTACSSDVSNDTIGGVAVDPSPENVDRTSDGIRAILRGGLSVPLLPGWNKKEHEQFLVAVTKCGVKNWIGIGLWYLKTKNREHIRSYCETFSNLGFTEDHATRYLQKHPPADDTIVTVNTDTTPFPTATPVNKGSGEHRDRGRPRSTNKRVHDDESSRGNRPWLEGVEPESALGRLLSRVPDPPQRHKTRVVPSQGEKMVPSTALGRHMMLSSALSTMLSQQPKPAQQVVYVPVYPASAAHPVQFSAPDDISRQSSWKPTHVYRRFSADGLGVMLPIAAGIGEHCPSASSASGNEPEVDDDINLDLSLG